MTLKRKPISINIRNIDDPSSEYESCEVAAYVYGDWAVHEIPEASRWRRRHHMKWQISHVPTGTLAYVGKRRDDCIAAAQRLCDLPHLTTSVKAAAQQTNGGGPDLAWMQQAARALGDVPVWVPGRISLIEPRDFPDRYAKYREWEGEL